MEGFLQILILIGFLVAGALLVKIHRAPAPKVTDLLIKAALWALLFVMGFRTGNDPAVASRIGELGLLAGATAVFTVLGTMAAILAGYAILGVLKIGERGENTSADKTAARNESRFEAADKTSRGREREIQDKPAGSSRRQLKTSLTLLAVVAAGLAAGFVLPPARGVDLGGITGWVLNALLFFIGMQFAQAGISLKSAFLRPDTLMVPIATAFGSIAAGLALVPLFKLSPGHSMALSAGFGWYSLAGVLISNLGDPALGSAAFLANLFRESLALLTIPLLARTRWPYMAIGIGGATSMDVTLPLIEQCVGPECVPVSFANGALLSLSVPILVPFLFRLG